MMNIFQEPLQDFSHWIGDQMQKRIYEFQEGSSSDKNLLGLKGSSLCELSKLGINVPPGFIITSETCRDFFHGDRAMAVHLNDALRTSLLKLEKSTGKSFSITETSPSTTMPLLLSVRSGAAVDMPSMMDTILNIGVNDLVVRRLIEQTKNPRFAYDVQKRFLHMFGTVVRKISKELFLTIVTEAKAHDGVVKDSDLSAEALQHIIHEFKKLVDVPDDPFEQLRVAIESIFGSWMSPRARKYRELHHISDELGTAIVVQSMVFGNMNSASSCVGKICTRNPDTGSNEIFGEYSCCVEGDDLSDSLDEKSNMIEDLRGFLPNVYSELKRISGVIEHVFGDSQDIEFTVQNGELFILETIKARRSPQASVRIAVEMVMSGHLTERESILRVNAEQMSYFLHPVVIQGKSRDLQPEFYPHLQILVDIDGAILGTGFETTMGSIAGKAVFTLKDVLAYRADGISTIFICNDSSTEDVEAIEHANGVTNAVVDLARSLDKTVITGAANCGMSLNMSEECVRDALGNICIVKGQEITLDGATGHILNGNIATIPTGTHSDFRTLMRWTDKYRRMPLFLGAYSGNEVYRSLELRSDGVGLFGIEGLFVDPSRRQALQGYLFTDSEQTKFACLHALQEFLTDDFFRIFGLLHNKFITLRLFSGSVNSFLPDDVEEIQQIADFYKMTPKSIRDKMSTLRESDPALGINGCRFAILHQDFLEIQVNAIFAAAHAIERSSGKIALKILVPMLTSEHELEKVIQLIHQHTDKIFALSQHRIAYEIGAMIETPRACLCVDKIARTTGVSFVLFSIDRLTELILGLSKEGSGKIIDTYIREGIIHKDPFKRLDRNGVGSFLTMGIKLTRRGFTQVKVGVYGSQLGNRGTLEYFNNLGVDFMVCSLEQLPVIKVVSAQAYISSTKVLEPYWADPFDMPSWL